MNILPHIRHCRFLSSSLKEFQNTANVLLLYLIAPHNFLMQNALPIKLGRNFIVDLFQTLADAPSEVVTMIADALEMRARDAAQHAILESYILDLSFNPGSVVVEIGCGTGVVCRRFAEIENVDKVVGIEPASILIDKARELAKSDKLEYHVAKGEQTGLEGGSADIVVLHTLLSHVPDQQAILSEVSRLLKPNGQIAVCDADFSKTSVAIGDSDPLQSCVDAWVEGNVSDRWLSPRLPGLLKENGYEISAFKGHNRVDVAGIGTGPLWISNGADALVSSGRISEAAGEAMKAECKRRIEAGQFYASLPFISAVARRG